MIYDPNLVVPPEVIQAVQTIREFAAKHSSGADWQVGGLGPVFPLQQQVAQLRSIVAFADARINNTLRIERREYRASVQVVTDLEGNTRELQGPPC